MNFYNPSDTGGIIKKRREEAGLTQEGLSRASGISRPTIGAYEENRGCPSVHNLVKIVAALGYSSIDQFLGDKIDLTKGKMSQIIHSYQEASLENKAIVDFILKIN
jgi:transcriptional regulator with XRE-family HTH domain